MKDIHLASIAKKIPGATCPDCGRSAEGGTSFDDKEASRKPKPGDFAVCLYCGKLHAYDDQLHLRQVTRPERRRITRDPRLKELLDIVSWAAREHRREWQ